MGLLQGGTKPRLYPDGLRPWLVPFILGDTLSLGKDEWINSEELLKVLAKPLLEPLWLRPWLVPFVLGVHFRNEWRPEVRLVQNRPLE